MSGSGMIASRPDWAEPLAANAPERLDHNPFYDNAARRLRVIAPELDLSPAMVALVDYACHQERVAERGRYFRKDPRDGLRRQCAAPDLDRLQLSDAEGSK